MQKTKIEINTLGGFWHLFAETTNDEQGIL